MVQRNAISKATESTNIAITIENVKHEDNDRYSTLEYIAHDKTAALPEKLWNISEDKETSAFQTSSDSKRLPPLPISRQTSISTLDAEKQGLAPPAPASWLHLPRRILYMILCVLTLLFLLALGLGLGLGLSHRLSKSSPLPSTANSSPSVSDPDSTANTSEPCTSAVLFTVLAPTNWGENMFLSGNTSSLGNWDPERAMPLESTNYTQTNPIWFARAEFDEGEVDNGVLGYKYLRKEGDGRFVWETHTTNRTVTIAGCRKDDEAGGAGAKGTLRINDTWTGPGAGLVRRLGGEMDPHHGEDGKVEGGRELDPHTAEKRGTVDWRMNRW